MFWRLLKTALFTVLVPGTVVYILPHWLILSESGAHAWGLGTWRYLGLVPLVIGVPVYLRCAWDFAVSGLGTPAPIDAPRKLVVKGLYRFVRNPMYVGVGSILAGEVILFESSALLAYLAILWLYFHLFVVFYEEPGLRRKFGGEYEDYCRRVPRWLPRFRERRSLVAL